MTKGKRIEVFLFLLFPKTKNENSHELGKAACKLHSNKKPKK